jgi:hypothetical protein
LPLLQLPSVGMHQPGQFSFVLGQEFEEGERLLRIERDLDIMLYPAGDEHFVFNEIVFPLARL